MPSQMASSIDDDGSLVVSSNLTSTMKTLFEEKKRSEFPHVKNLKKNLDPQKLDHVRVGDTVTRILSGQFQGECYKAWFGY